MERWVGVGLVGVGGQEYTHTHTHTHTHISFLESHSNQCFRLTYIRIPLSLG